MKTRILSLFAIAAMAMCTSCTKEDISQEEQPQSGPFEVTISAEMSEFAPTTKSTAESCIRMKWSAGDIVWAYDKDGAKLNGLTVSLDEGDYYVAKLTGTLSQIPSDNTLYLVHSSLLSTTSQPAYSDLAAISMASQSADVTPFVAYAVVENVTANPSNLKTKFSFATSVLKINATGIVTGETLTSATLSDINTTCQLTIDGENKEFVITQNSTSGTITKALSGTVSNGRASFYVGVPKFENKTTDRILTVNTTTSGSAAKEYYDYAVVADGKDENKYINYVYEVKTLDYTDEYGTSRGSGTYIASTGVVWAPVNCGYEPENYKYGKLYQWGRKYGCGYNDGDTNLETLIQEGANSQTTLAAEDAAKFYYTTEGEESFDWCSAHYYNLWDSSITAACIETGHIPAKTDRDPCPAGWRVPTHAELDALLGGNSSPSLTTVGEQDGVYFNGTSNPGTTGVFLPAAGCRVYINDTANIRGFCGYYWCSSANNDYRAWFLGFGVDLDYFAEMNSSSRACGFSVRCVQE